MPDCPIGGRKVGRTLRRAARGAAFAALVVCANAAVARAGDDTDTSSSTSFYDEMLQVIGVQGGSNIQYGERSPLVVPPTRDLPPPMADRPPAVPDWPKDPDIMARAKSKAKEVVKPHPDYVIDSSRPLRPDELAVPGAAPASSGGRGPNDDPEAQQINPAVTQPNQKSLFSLDLLNTNKSEYATFTGEPSRGSLTDPPVGYLTPSPDQPYGIGPAQKKYKVPTVGDRMEPTSGTASGTGN
jgi:hypothetical protein